MIALSTGSLHTYGVSRVFSLAARVGFDGVEVLIDNRWDTRQANYLSHLSAEGNLPICSLHDPFVPRIPDWPSDPLARLHKTLNLAQELDVKTVVVHLPLRSGYVVAHGFDRTIVLPTFPSPYTDLRRWMMNDMASFEAQSGLQLCVENMPSRRLFRWRYNPYLWNSVEEWQPFPHLTLDTTHLGTWDLDPLAVYRAASCCVSHVHLSNFNGREHRRLEDGHLALAVFLSNLRDDGFRGTIVVELCPEALDARVEARVLAHLRTQLAFCRRYFG